RRLLAGLFLSIHDAEPEPDHVEEAIIALRIAALEQEQRQLRAEIERAERATNAPEIARLQQAKLDLDRRLRELD
ncbi:MAG: DNA primase, partial [Acidobacteriaceae bacterium]